MISTRRAGPHLLLACICLAYLALATAWSTMIPAWEANDEPAHVANIEDIALNHRIPPLDLYSRFPIPGSPRFKRIDWHETHQPPLYYFVAALWQQCLGIPPAYPNPLERSGWQGNAPAQLVYAHNYDDEQRAQAEVLHQLRLLSLFIGLLTVLLVYQAARLALGQTELAAGVAAFVAFLPKFVVVSATVTNDGLVILLSTAILVLVLNYWQVQNRADWSSARLAVAVGVTAGAAALTKLNSLPLLAVWAPALLCGPAPLGRRLSNLAMASCTFATVAGWWFARNFKLYGEVLAGDVAARRLRIWFPDLIAPAQVSAAENSGLWQRFFVFLPSTLTRSMWYTGGWNQFALPFGINVTLLAVACIALAAGLWAFWRRKDALGNGLERKVGWLLAGWIIAGLAAVVIIALKTNQAEGRIAYIGIGGFATLAVLGVWEISLWCTGRARMGRLALAFWPLIFLALDCYVLVCFVSPFRGL